MSPNVCNRSKTLHSVHHSQHVGMWRPKPLTSTHCAGSVTIKWQSKKASVCFRSDFNTGAPIEMLGTMCPSCNRRNRNGQLCAECNAAEAGGGGCCLAVRPSIFSQRRRRRLRVQGIWPIEHHSSDEQ